MPCGLPDTPFLLRSKLKIQRLSTPNIDKKYAAREWRARTSKGGVTGESIIALQTAARGVGNNSGGGAYITIGGTWTTGIRAMGYLDLPRLRFGMKFYGSDTIVLRVVAYHLWPGGSGSTTVHQQNIYAPHGSIFHRTIDLPTGFGATWAEAEHGYTALDFQFTAPSGNYYIPVVGPYLCVEGGDGT